MSVSKKQYDKMAKKATPPSPWFKNCVCAFIVGGAICTFGQFLFNVYSMCGMMEDAARTAVSVTIIALTAILTGLHAWDKIGKFAGAGALVPITGFANAVASPALEFKSEGQVTGVGAKMFTVAGPVIVFGTLFSVLYGIIYYIVEVLL